MKRYVTAILTTTALVLIGLRPVNAQTVIPVEAGQNTIIDAVAAAAPGDIIELTTDGGEYLNDADIEINFPLTIRAAGGLAQRPVLKHNGTQGTKTIIRVFNSIELEGLELDGEASGTDPVKYAMRTGDTQGATADNYNLRAYDTIFRNVIKGSDGNAFRAYSFTIADTVLFDNCLFDNMGKEAIRLRDEDSDRPGFGFFNVNYFQVTNSTFSQIKNDAISVYGGDQDPNTPGPIVRISDVTVDNAGHYLLNLKYVDDAIVNNTILTNNYDIVNATGKTLGAPWLETAATIQNSDTLNVSDDGAWTGGGTPTVANLLAEDPQYADPGNFDFTIPEGSPLLSSGENGGGMGDPFWRSVLFVAAGQNSILDAVDISRPGAIIELFSDGGEYWNDDEIRVRKPLTIRASAGLAARPILRNNGTDGTKDIIRVYDDLTLRGLELDGLANDPDPTLAAKYAIRTSDTGSEVKPDYVFKAYDSYFHDVVKGSDGNAFRAYGETMADTILFDNCLFRNFGKEGIRVRDEDSNRPGFGFFNVKYFQVTNSTFAGVKNDAISVYGGDQDPNTPGPEVYLDHLTIDNAGHYVVNLKFVDNAMIKNSLLTNNYDIVNATGKTLGAPWLETAATIAFSDTLNVSDDGAWTGGGTPTVTSLLAVDPLYTDPANFDFTLQAGSPVLSAGEGGAAMGDSRWAVSTGIEADNSEIPEFFSLKQNYPNPFNPATVIPFELSEAGHVSLTVYDLLGRSVTTLVDQTLAAGTYRADFVADDLPSGMYLYVLKAGDLSSQKSMILLK